MKKPRGSVLCQMVFWEVWHHAVVTVLLLFGSHSVRLHPIAISLNNYSSTRTAPDFDGGSCFLRHTRLQPTISLALTVNKLRIKSFSDWVELVSPSVQNPKISLPKDLDMHKTRNANDHPKIILFHSTHLVLALLFPTIIINTLSIVHHVCWCSV